LFHRFLFRTFRRILEGVELHSDAEHELPQVLLHLQVLRVLALPQPESGEESNCSFLRYSKASGLYYKHTMIVNDDSSVIR
jgi:hypothetical protein